MHHAPCALEGRASKHDRRSERRSTYHVRPQDPLVSSDHLFAFVQQTPSSSDAVPVKQYPASSRVNRYGFFILSARCGSALRIPPSLLADRRFRKVKRRPASARCAEIDQYRPT